MSFQEIGLSYHLEKNIWMNFPGSANKGERCHTWMCSMRNRVMNLISYPLYRSCLNRFVTNFLSLFNDDTWKSSFVSSSLEFTYFSKLGISNPLWDPLIMLLLDQIKWFQSVCNAIIQWRMKFSYIDKLTLKILLILSGEKFKKFNFIISNFLSPAFRWMIWAKIWKIYRFQPNQMWEKSLKLGSNCVQRLYMMPTSCFKWNDVKIFRSA